MPTRRVLLLSVVLTLCSPGELSKEIPKAETSGTDKLQIPVEMRVQFLVPPELNAVVPLQLTVRSEIELTESEVEFQLPKQFEMVIAPLDVARPVRAGEEQTYVAHVRRVEIEEAEIVAYLKGASGDFHFAKRTQVFVGGGTGHAYVEPNPRRYFSPQGISKGISLSGAVPPPLSSRSPRLVRKGRQGTSEATNISPSVPGPGQIVVWGYIYSQDRNGIPQTVRYARVEIWDEGLVFDTKLATGYTDNSGYFQSPALSNTDDWGTLDIYIKVYATDDYSVNVTDFNGTLYSEKSTTTSNVPDGYLEKGFPSTNPISDINRRPAYFIYDKIANDAYDYLLNQVGWDNSYNLQVRWSATNNTDGTHYHPGGSIDLLVFDRWDTDVFFHEYGHFVMYKIYGNVLPDAPNCIPHWWSDNRSNGCAWVEGWADFLQGAIQNDRYLTQTEDEIWTIDMEIPDPPASGSDSEGAVAASLWDVFDSATETWDTINLWINGPSSKGIWYIANTYRPVDAQGFYDQWYSNGGGNQREVASIFDHHLVLAPPAPPALVSPSNGQTGVSTSPTLSWTASSGTTGYDVYLGTSSPPPLSITNLSSTNYAAGPLTAGLTYYWNVVARNSNGGTASPIYTFTTLALPVVGLTPSTLNLGEEVLGTTSAPQTVTLANVGNAVLNITSITASGDFAQTNDCGASLAATASCTLSVTFTPTAAGSRTGALTITDNASGSPHTVALAGTGTDFSLSSDPTSRTVTAGQSATYTLSVGPVSGFNQAVALSCTKPTQMTLATCTVSPSTVTPDGTNAATVTVTVTTTARGMAPPFGGPREDRGERRAPLFGGHRPPLQLPLQVWLLALLAVTVVAAAFRPPHGNVRLKPNTAFPLAGALLLVLLWAACGGGGGRGGGNPGTPLGTYTLTVTGTVATGSGNLGHDLTFTLKVN